MISLKKDKSPGKKTGRTNEKPELLKKDITQTV